MALRDLLIRIGGETKGLDKALDAVEKRLGGLGGRLGGALGGLAAGFSVKAIVDASIEAEKAVSGLETVLASTGNTTGLTRDRLIEMSAELQKVSTFGDEAILQAETNLARYSKVSGEVYQRALQGSIDLGTRTGDLAGAADLLGRALQRPDLGLKALRSSGVAFSESVEQQVKALVDQGRTLDAQKILLGGLESAYGGTARAATETFGGALTQLKEAAGDLLENPGGLRENTKAVKDFTAALQDPETIAAANKLTQAVFDGFSLAVRGITTAVELAEFFGITIGKLVDGPAGDVTFLTDRIGELGSQLERLQRIRAANPQAQNDIGLNKAIEQTSAKLADLERRKRAILDLGGYDGPAAAPTAAPAATPGKPQAQDEPPAVLTPEDVAKAAAAAREAYAVLKAQLDGQLAGLRESVTRELAEIDRQLASNDLGFAAAADARIAAQQRVIDAELAARRSQLKRSADPSDRAALIEQITALEAKRGEVAVDARRDQAAAEKALQLELQDVANELKRATGDELGAQLGEIESRYQELLKRLRAENNTAGVSLVERLIGSQKDRAQLDDLERRIAEIQQAGAARQQSIANQRTAGLLGERRAAEQLIGVNLETADSLEALVAEYQALALAAGDPAALAQVEALRAAILQLRDTTSQASKQIASSLRQGFEGVFSTALRDINDVDDALRNLATTFADTLAQVASKNLVDSIFGSEGGKGDLFGKVGDLITGGGQPAAGGGDSGGGLGDLFSGVTDFFGGLFDGGNSAPNTSGDNSGGFGDLLGGVSDFFGGLFGDSSSAPDASGDSGGGIGDLLGGVSDFFGGLFGGGSSAGVVEPESGARIAVIDRINSVGVIDKIGGGDGGGLLDSVSGLLGDKGFLDGVSGLFGGGKSEGNAGDLGAGLTSLVGDVFKSPDGQSVGDVIGSFSSLLGDADGKDLGGLLGDFGGLLGDGGLSGILGSLGSLFGGGSGGGGLGSLVSLGASLFAGGGAGASAGLLGSLFHSGGIAGGAAPARMVPDLAYALAPRYHNGGLAGFAPDEVPAILKRNEEVLTESDPRHRNNGGLAPSAPQQGVRILNVVDPSIVEQYMATPAGERLIVNAIRRNRGAVAQELR